MGSTYGKGEMRAAGLSPAQRCSYRGALWHGGPPAIISIALSKFGRTHRITCSLIHSTTAVIKVRLPRHYAYALHHTSVVMVCHPPLEARTFTSRKEFVVAAVHV